MIVVVTPPPLKPSEPGLSGGAAASVLHSLGTDVRWVDASLAWHRFVMDPGQSQAILQRLKSAPGLSALARSAVRAGARPAPLQRVETYQDRSVYTSAVNDLENALRLAALPFDGLRLGIGMFAVDTPHRRLESSATLAWLSSTRGPFDDYYIQELIPSLEREHATAVAVSLTFQQQAPAAFRLAALLQERMPDAIRVLGGPLVACWRAVGFPLDKEPFSLFHRVVTGTAQDLAELARVADRDTTVGTRVAARSLQAGLAASPPEGAAGPVEPLVWESPLSVPLDQAPWHDYLSPTPTVPVALGRGCYWRRCTFCPDHLHDKHVPCHVDRLSDWLHQVARRFPRGAMLHLTDSALPVGHLRHIASVIRRDGLALAWHGFVRVEPELAEGDVVRELAAGGCAMLQLGVESGSPGILRKLGKGASPELARRVLRTCAAAGVRTHVYLLFGVPGETDGDRQQTLSLVREEAGSIHAINAALLNLPKGSPMHAHAARFGITELVPFGSDTDLSLYDDFRCGPSHPRREARRWLAHAFFKDAAVRSIQGRLRAPFKANHLCFLDQGPTQG